MPEMRLERKNGHENQEKKREPVWSESCACSCCAKDSVGQTRATENFGVASAFQHFAHHRLRKDADRRPSTTRWVGLGQQAKRAQRATILEDRNNCSAIGWIQIAETHKFGANWHGSNGYKYQMNQSTRCPQ